MTLDSLVLSIIKKGNPCAVHLDVGYDELPQEFRLDDKAKSVIEFNRRVIDTVHDITPAVSVNTPSLMRYGTDAVADVVSYAREKKMFAIADAKCSGEPVSSKAEAEFYYDSLGFDCVTVVPYYGSDGLKPFIERCKTREKSMFVVSHSDNGSPTEFQELMAGMRMLYRAACERAFLWNEKTEGNMGYGSIGVMLGGLPREVLREFRNSYKNMPFLLTGYDGKRNSAESISPAFDLRGLGGIASVGRLITLPQTDGDWKEAVRTSAENVQKDLRLCF